VRDTWRNEDLGRGAPHDHQAIAVVLRLEVPHVLPQQLGQFLLVLAGLDVLPLEPLHVMLVEHGRHRGDGLEEVLDRLDIFMLIEHAAVEAALVEIVRHRVPGAEDDILELRERDEILDQRLAIFSALAQADVAHLGEGADRLRLAAADQLDAGDEGRRHGAETHTENTKLAGGRSNRPGCSSCHAQGPFGASGDWAPSVTW
jgi:hypothetical protein